jgi:hypothetical protein
MTGGIADWPTVSNVSRIKVTVMTRPTPGLSFRLLPANKESSTPDMFYKRESQEKTLLQRPEFFLLRSPHD